MDVNACVEVLSVLFQNNFIHNVNMVENWE